MDTDTRPLVIKRFGAFEVRLNNRTVPELRRRSGEALPAFLTGDTPAEVHPRCRLYECYLKRQLL